MNAPCELVLVNTPADLPEALRDAALAHLATVTRRTADELAALWSHPRPVLARTADRAEALRLQQDIRRAGWHSELRDAAPRTAPAKAERVCTACSHTNAPLARFCGECGAALPALPVLAPGQREADNDDMIGATARSVAGLAGLPPVKGFSVGALFDEVFKRRTPAEIEDHLMAGTLRTTPPVTDVSCDWPKPWMFARLFLVSAFLFAMFWAGYRYFQNANLVPGAMVIGSFVVPMTVVLLFYELNAPRNVSLLLVAKLVLLGGAWSLVISLALFKLGEDVSSLIGASAAGLIEETGKLAAVVFATRSLSPVRYRYTLNGLLFGAAVGAGFAAFESAGYAFNNMLKSGLGAMDSVILLRGALAPFGHVVWTAIAAGALWRVKGALSYHGTLLAEPRFFGLFIASVVCHAIWNAPFSVGPGLTKYVLLGGVAWMIALSLVQDGLGQVRREQQTVGTPGA